MLITHTSEVANGGFSNLSPATSFGKKSLVTKPS